MKFYTQYDRPEKVFESDFQKSKTEQAGYMSPKIQIERLITAGKNLLAYRREMYDFGEGEREENIDVAVRDPNYDMADAYQAKENLTRKLAEDDKRFKMEKIEKLEEEKAKAKIEKAKVDKTEQEKT